VRKGSIIIILTIALAVVIGVVGVLGYQKFLAKPKTSETANQPVNSTFEETKASPVQSGSSETANWKTYTGKYFSIKYPPDFSIQSVPPVTSPEYPEVLDTLTLRNKNGFIAISAAKNYQNLTISNALGKGPHSRYGDEFIQGKQISVFTIDGTEAKGINDLPIGASGNSSDLVFIKADKIYEVVSEPPQVNTVTSILNTFKFAN